MTMNITTLYLYGIKFMHLVDVYQKIGKITVHGAGMFVSVFTKYDRFERREQAFLKMCL